MSIQTKLMSTAEADELFIRAVDTHLAQFIADETQAAATDRMAQLWQHIAESTTGGKRTRPMLVNLGYRIVDDGPAWIRIELGCAFELLHTALVLHDDIIDHDFIRRGQPTLSAHYRDAALALGKPQAAAEHLGNAAALLAGDVLIAKAIELVHEACCDLPQGGRIIEVFQTAIQHSAAGELDDVLFSARLESAQLTDVLRMHRLKTAAYSFEAPMVTGALAAGAGPNVVDPLHSLAQLLGSCYQIIDDVLGTFGDAATTGKANDSDLREGKTTVLIALAETIDTAAPIVSGWRAGEVSDAAMRALLVTHDIETKARALAEQCCTEARALLAELPAPAGVRTVLGQLIGDLLRRNH